MNTFLTSAVILAWIAILVLAFGMAGLLRQIHGLAAGEVQSVLPTTGPASGKRVHPSSGLPDIGRGLLLFVGEECQVCSRVLPPVLSRHRDGWSDRTVLVTGGQAEALNKKISAGYQVIEGKRALFEYYAVPATPFAVASRDGVVTESSPVGSQHRLEQFGMAALEGSETDGAASN